MPKKYLPNFIFFPFTIRLFVCYDAMNSRPFTATPKWSRFVAGVTQFLGFDSHNLK